MKTFNSKTSSDGESQIGMNSYQGRDAPRKSKHAINNTDLAICKTLMDIDNEEDLAVIKEKVPYSKEQASKNKRRHLSD